MSVGVEVPARAAPRDRRIRDHRTALTAIGVLAIAALAFVVRFGLLTRGVGLIAPDGYDDGVYYAAADALVHGRLPYRDFLLLHPPGILLALAPFAALGSAFGDPAGVAAGRLAFLCLGAANTAAITLLAARHGRLAAALAGITAAVFFPLASAERSTLLEPLGTACLLASLLLARRATPRALLAAGVVAGLSIDVKIWYVVPVLVVIAFQDVQRVRLLLGAAAGASLVALPFFAAAPAAMVREVVLDQLGRSRMLRESVTARLLAIAGDPTSGIAATRDQQRIDVVVIVVAVAAIAAALGVRGARRYPVLVIATVLVLLAGPSFYRHYVAYTAPWLAITLGIGLARLLAAIPPRRLRLGIAALLVVAFGAINLAPDLSSVGLAFPAAALRPASQAVRGCVVSDDPQVLADLDVLSRDLARGCAIRPDVTGYTYDRDDERAAGVDVALPQNQRWQHDVLGYLTSGGAVILARRGTGLSAASLAAVAADPSLAARGRWVLRSVPQGL